MGLKQPEMNEFEKAIAEIAEKQRTNRNIKSTIITDNIRVSSAIIFYEANFGDYYQYETIVFSKDERIPWDMEIHGTKSYGDDESLIKSAIEWHDEEVAEIIETINALKK